MENNDKPAIIYNVKGDMHNYPTAATVNNYYGDKFASEDKLTRENTPIAPSLMKYIYDDEKRAKVAVALAACKSTKDLSLTIERFCNDKIFKLSQVVDSTFRDSIISLLGFETNDQALKKIIERANVG